MNTKVFLSPIFGLTLVFIIVTLSGCDKVIPTVKVEGLPNTFGLSAKRWGGNVVFVTVWDPNKSPREVVWHIEATDNIPVSGFVVTVGKIPEGFKQVTPPPVEKFSPVPRKKYEIGIWCNFQPDAFPLETVWVAE